MAIENMTADHMVDMCGMKTVYHTKLNDARISGLMQVHGDRDELVLIGDMILTNNGDAFGAALEAGRVTPYFGYKVPMDQAVWVLFLPPFYLFADAKKDWK